MSKHTKRPWEITGHGNQYATIWGAGRGVAVVRNLSYLVLGETEANALLISQAPALLDALKDLHARLLGMEAFGPMSTNDISDLLVIAEQAIKKAEEA